MDKETAEAKLRRLTAKVDIKFVNPQNGMQGTAYGLHAGNGKPLVHWENGKRGTTEDVYAPLNPSVDTDELKRLIQAADNAKAALDAFKSAHRLDGYSSLGTIVRKAINDARPKNSAPTD